MMGYKPVRSEARTTPRYGSAVVHPVCIHRRGRAAPRGYGLAVGPHAGIPRVPCEESRK